MNIDVEGLLAKARWRREIEMRPQERKHVTDSPLAEALRTELRSILDNEGKPFDIQVARHVYDFAIAAKDLLTVSVKTVEDAVKVVADNGGAMESLAGPGDPPPPAQAAETYGARILRELLATMSASFLGTGSTGAGDPRALVAAIADAREKGMPDVASALERKLVGTSLEVPAPKAEITHVEIVRGSYEHGFVDGSMQDNFDRGIVDGASAIAMASRTSAYRAGWEAGRTRRYLNEASERVGGSTDQDGPSPLGSGDPPQLPAAGGAS